MATKLRPSSTKPNTPDEQIEYLFIPNTLNTPNAKTREILDKSDRSEDIIECGSFENFKAALSE